MSNYMVPRRGVVASLAAIVCLSTVLSHTVFADELAADAFQRLVIDVGTRHYPALPLRPGQTSLEVRWGDHRLYLGNVYAVARQLPSETRERVVLEFLSRFSPEADKRTEAAKAETRDWTKARALLRPKLFPIETVRMAPWLVTQPFATGVVIGYALDLGDKDLYVDADKMAPWCRPISDVHEAALSNLEAMSKDVAVYPPRPVGSTGGLAVIDTGDGYDAARILLPGLRARLVDALGPRVMAGVPARDMFIAWSAGLSKQREFESEVRDLAVKMPHSVTDRIFVIERGGIRLAAAEEL